MSKRIFTICVFMFLSTLLLAGDVTVFVDLGFSQDGKEYVFAQYGSLDRSQQGFADIYTVDIPKNDYIDAGCFNTFPSAQTAKKSGLSVYNALFAKNSNYFNKLSLQVANLENTIYIKNNKKNPLDEIVFKDFEGSTKENPLTYYIRLIPWYSEKPAVLESSFFISLEKRNKNETVLEKQVAGNPAIKRNGVTGYSIERIIQSPDQKSLIFIIEKTIVTATGTSIRYMVEALQIK